jgi:uncharacterized repeat protein (TIGR03803 family)
MRVRRGIALRLEILEERVLLSSGVGKPAVAAAIMASKTLKPFNFSGNLPLKLTATFDQEIGASTYTEVTPGFREKKPFPPMSERVKVSGTLAYPGSTSSDGLPDLSGSVFELSNASGSLRVSISSSTTDVYDFTISGGTKRFVRADGTTGTALFGVAPKTGFALKFKTTGHGSQSSHPPVTGTLVTLASFDGASSGTNGGYPNAGVTLDSQGNLYGTTVNGGATGDGTVFEIKKGSDTITTLGSFNGTNGIEPLGGVALGAQGNLYGTTEKGGSDSSGTVWEIVNGSNTITTLASLSGTNGDPTGGVSLDAQGNLYGSGYESVWELAKGSSTVTTLFANRSSGATLTLDAQGNIYGTGSGSLGHVGQGSVWELSRLANDSYAVINEYFFNGTNGAYPGNSVTLDAQGNLYGTTSEGGAYGDGTLWEVVKGGSTITTLISFDGANGSRPESGVAVDGVGNLYGTTGDGGADGSGTVWEFIVGTAPSVRARA